MWGIPTKCMCRQHLLGEHVENHMFLSVLEKKKVSIQGYVDCGQCDISKLAERHSELVNEMNIRHYNHKSPIIDNKDVIIQYGVSKYGIVPVDIKTNLKTLAHRCEECKRLQIKYGYYK
jgi:hypothetical protein